MSRLKEELIPYLKKMHYTHVEFLPVMTHPLDMSWGYQLMGYFAFDSTFGSPEDFRTLSRLVTLIILALLSTGYQGILHKMMML